MSRFRPLSPLLMQVLANGDPSNSAVERMTQLVQECLALSAGMAVANPKGNFAFHSLKMDSSPGSTDEAPGPDFWAHVVVSPSVSASVASPVSCATLPSTHSRCTVLLDLLMRRLALTSGLAFLLLCIHSSVSTPQDKMSCMHSRWTVLLDLLTRRLALTAGIALG